MLELAILGILHEAPMHGYELRKRLHDTIGIFRTFSCGTLYPTLRRMSRAGLIAEEAEGSGDRGRGRRARRVYRLTAEGERRFAELVGDCGPNACEDEAFGIHVAFFARTPVDCRMRILRARRRRVEEREEALRAALTSSDGPGSGERGDRYVRELRLLRLRTCEHEVRWLNDLIERERAEHGSARSDRGDGT